jgi:hypothetical protein
MSRFRNGDDGVGRLQRLRLCFHSLVGLAWLVAGVPRPAGACPRCYESYSGKVLETYYFSTAMLSLLPFAVIGVVVLVAWRIALASPVLGEERQGTGGSS